MSSQASNQAIDEIRKASAKQHDAYVFLFGRILMAAPESFLKEESVDKLTNLLDTLSRCQRVIRKVRVLQFMMEKMDDSLAVADLSNLAALHKNKCSEVEASLQLLIASMNLTKNWGIIVRSAFTDFRDANSNLGYREIQGDLLHALDHNHILDSILNP